MKCNLLFLLLMVFSNILHAETINEKYADLDISNFSDSFVRSYNSIVKNGYNFNKNMYILEYSCGGGAVCLNIYDPTIKKIIDFPDNYILLRDNKKFKAKYSLSSNTIYISGYSAYDLKYYNNVGYEYINGELKDI